MITFTTAKPMKEPVRPTAPRITGNASDSTPFIIQPLNAEIPIPAARTRSGNSSLIITHVDTFRQVCIAPTKQTMSTSRIQGRAGLSAGSSMDAPAMSTWKNAVEL